MLAIAVLQTASSAAQTVSTNENPAATAGSGGPAPGETSAADIILGRELGNQGMVLAANGDCVRAVDPLARSEALHHAPTTLTVLGECHIANGALVQGIGELTRVVREQLDSRAPPIYRAAQERARLHLEQALPRLPKMKLVVKGVDASVPLTISLDGEPIPSASLGMERPVDPRLHRVDVSAPGYQPAHDELDVHEGGTQTLILSLEPLAPSPAAQPSLAEPRTVPGGADESADIHRGHTYLPAYVAFGAGAFGIAAGATLGAITLSTTSSLDSVCHTRSTCPPDEKSNITSAKTTALLSTVGFGLGAVGALLGVYFALRPISTDRVSATTLAPLGASHPRVWPLIGLGSIGVGGTL